MASIPALIKSDGTTTTSQEEVILELQNFYSGLLCNDSPVQPVRPEIILQGPLLSDVDNALLSVPIDDTIIKDAFFHIGDDKAPGPDGFTATFFKNNGTLLRLIFCRLYMNSSRKENGSNN